MLPMTAAVANGQAKGKQRAREKQTANGQAGCAACGALGAKKRLHIPGAAIHGSVVCANHETRWVLCFMTDNCPFLAPPPFSRRFGHCRHQMRCACIPPWPVQRVCSYAAAIRGRPTPDHERLVGRDAVMRTHRPVHGPELQLMQLMLRTIARPAVALLCRGLGRGPVARFARFGLPRARALDLNHEKPRSRGRVRAEQINGRGRVAKGWQVQRDLRGHGKPFAMFRNVPNKAERRAIKTIRPRRSCTSGSKFGPALNLPVDELPMSRA